MRPAEGRKSLAGPQEKWARTQINGWFWTFSLWFWESRSTHCTARSCHSPYLLVSMFLPPVGSCPSTLRWRSEGYWLTMSQTMYSPQFNISPLPVPLGLLFPVMRSTLNSSNQCFLNPNHTPYTNGLTHSCQQPRGVQTPLSLGYKWGNCSTERQSPPITVIMR